MENLITTRITATRRRITFVALGEGTLNMRDMKMQDWKKAGKEKHEKPYVK